MLFPGILIPELGVWEETGGEGVENNKGFLSVTVRSRLHNNAINQMHADLKSQCFLSVGLILLKNVKG